VKSEIIFESDIIDMDLSIYCDLIVKGNVINSEISCENNLFVEGDIFSDKKVVYVKNDLNTVSINDSLILCKGNLKFKVKIQNSELYVDKLVYGSSKSSIESCFIQT